MITELGHFALILAFMVAIVQTVVPLIGAHKRWASVDGGGGTCGFGAVLAHGFAFAALTMGFITSDFSCSLVVLNSHSAKPMLYKISGDMGEPRRVHVACGC